MSDLRIHHVNDYEECIERHYLKPRHQLLDSEQINQEFGNVSIILTFKNKLPWHLKLSATAYPDRNFAESKPLEALMELIGD